MGRDVALEITNEIIHEVEKLSGIGMTQKQIANYYGVSQVTWNKYKKKDKRLKKAYKKGKAKAIALVAGRLMQLINSGNLTAIIFYLKTQGGWTEKTALTVENNYKIKSKKSEFKIDTQDAIEASKIYQSIMTGSYKDERNSPS